MWHDNRRGRLDIEALADSTSAGRVQQWIVGVGLAGLLAVYSIVCIVSQRALFLRGRRRLGIVEMQGTDAIAVGILYLSAALFMHCHWFWSAHPDYHGYAHLGKIAGLVGVVSGAGCLFYNFVFVN